MGLYEQYPLLQRVKSTLNRVQNTEESTGKAQYTILQTAQKPGFRGRSGAFMNKFNWSKLKNDLRLNPAQKKTVNKILVSLQVPARDQYRNRPALNFNISKLTIPQINAEVRRRVNAKRRPAVQSSENRNVFYNAKQTFNNENKNLAAQMLRQHREAYGE